MINEQMINAHNLECEKLKEQCGDGPWQREPNRIEWVHAGLNCLALRQQHSGHWCGYVGLRPGHKYYGLEASYRSNGEDKPGAYDLDIPGAHCGITYGRKCQGDVCHISENDELYWLGFDCNHAWDITPMDTSEGQREWAKFKTDATYKTLAYVKGCVEEMAEHLAAT